VDGAGDLFIADTDNRRVVELLPTGVQKTVATGLPSKFILAADSAGDVFVEDISNNHLLKFAPGLPVTVTAAPPINVVPPAPVIIGENPLFQRKLKHGKPVGKPVLIGYMIDFSNKLNAASADIATNYQVDTLRTKKVKKKKVLVLQPVHDFRVSYNDTNATVELLFTNRPTLKTGGRITVVGGPSSGVTDLSGSFVSGDRVLAISPGGNRIALA
jgi:hypothetical protein